MGVCHSHWPDQHARDRLIQAVWDRRDRRPGRRDKSWGDGRLHRCVRSRWGRLHFIPHWRALSPRRVGKRLVEEAFRRLPAGLVVEAWVGAFNRASLAATPRLGFQLDRIIEDDGHTVYVFARKT